jgi:DNA-binding response OmpR family regulator
MATILVVDDEQAIRELISVILRSAGHQIIGASNGMEGIALFRSSPERFDLILTDLQMPVMNGHQLIQLARETNLHAKIICMSGYTDESIPAGTKFLQKPFQPAVLLARVNEVLNQPAPRASDA